MHHIILMTCCLTRAVNCLHAVQVNFIVRIILLSPCSCSSQTALRPRGHSYDVARVVYDQINSAFILWSLHVVLCLTVIVTFRVSRRRREMYIGHAGLLCVCM